MKDEREMNQNIQEKVLDPASGMGMLFVTGLGSLAGLFLCVFSFILFEGLTAGLLLALGILCIIVFPVLMGGLKIVKPNEALVLTLFGKYYGTVKKDGFYFVNPFASGFNPSAPGFMEEVSAELQDIGKKGASAKKNKAQSGRKTVSTKTMTLNNAQQKVNDVDGNPVIIGSVVIWRIVNPTKAVFNVENYSEYVSIQCDSTIRNIARLFLTILLKARMMSLH